MTFKPAKCPNCAGDLQVPEDRDSVKCMYCGSDIVVREAIKLAGGKNIGNLIFLAKNAYDLEKYGEAFSYYCEALEYDVNNYEAWIGKGISGILIYKISEAELDHCLNHAINLLSGNNKNIIIALEICLDKLISIDQSGNLHLPLSSPWKIFSNVLLKHDQNNAKASTVLNLYPADESFYLKASLEQRYRVIAGVLLFINNHPLYKEKRINIIKCFITSLNMPGFGIEQGTIDNQNISTNSLEELINKFESIFNDCEIMELKKRFIEMCIHCLGKATDGCRYTYKDRYYYEKQLLALCIKYYHQILSIDKYYKADLPIKIKTYKFDRNGNRNQCFISTAAYGSPLASEVIFLKQFRDVYLFTSPLGQSLMSFYYLCSPPIASFIAKSELVRKIARAFLSPIILLIKAIQEKEANQP
jgi:DNA-directed RNA polymerase subunit RPC12/RpoP